MQLVGPLRVLSQVSALSAVLLTRGFYRLADELLLSLETPEITVVAPPALSAVLLTSVLLTSVLLMAVLRTRCDLEDNPSVGVSRNSCNRCALGKPRDNGRGNGRCATGFIGCSADPLIRRLADSLTR